MLRNELLDRLSGDCDVTICLSGGMDSALIASIGLEFGLSRGIVTGAADCADIESAERIAGKIGIELRKLSLNDDEILRAAGEIANIAGITDPLIVSFELPIYAALKSAEEHMVITGQGADELFGGYARYISMPPHEFRSARDADIERVITTVVSIEDALAAHWDKTIIRPYLCEEILGFARKLPLELVLPAPERKKIVRKALIRSGVPEEDIAEKKAAQYGSGVSAVLKRAAKRGGESMGELISRLAREA